MVAIRFGGYRQTRARAATLVLQKSRIECVALFFARQAAASFLFYKMDVQSNGWSGHWCIEELKFYGSDDARIATDPSMGSAQTVYSASYDAGVWETGGGQHHQASKRSIWAYISVLNLVTFGTCRHQAWVVGQCPLGCLLGASWRPFLASWGLLQVSQGPLGGLLENSSAPLGRLGDFLALSRAILAQEGSRGQLDILPLGPKTLKTH